MSDGLIGDGNGGTIDPKTVSTHELLALLHAKWDDRIRLLEQSSARAEGARKAYYTLAALVVAILLSASGLIIANQLTRADVSRQIQTEAPWVTDRRAVLLSIRDGVMADRGIQKRLDLIDKLDRFFCRTRESHGLPPC